MRKRISVWCACACLCVLMLVPVQAQEASIITSISFPNDSAVAEENLSVSGYGDKDSGYAASTVGGRLYASVSGTDLRKLEWSKGEYVGVGMQPVMTGGTKNPWGSGAYLELRVSTRGYENITFSADIGATKKGPRDYKLQYSTDGVTFTDVAGCVFTVTANKTMYQAFENAALPAAADNAEMLYIRIAVASNILVGGSAGLIGGTGGETAINNIEVRGIPMATTTAVTTTTATEPADVPTTTAAVKDTSAAQGTTVTTTIATVHPTVTQIIPSTTATAPTSVSDVKTGETSHIAAWSAAMLVSLLLIGAAACNHRKKKI